MRRAASVAAALAIFAGSAGAETLLNEDFQNGKADGWAASGDVRLSDYQGNISLKLTGRASASRMISTQGYKSIRVTISFAALSLRGVEACIGEVSGDDANWTQILRVGHGRDDGITLHSGTGTAPDLDDNPKVVIRLRAQSPSGGTCWADNIKVTGSRLAAEPSAFDPGGGRRALTADDLLAPAGEAKPVPMDAFGPSPDAGRAAARFEGRLILGDARDSGFKVYRDKYGDAKTNGGAATHLPPFDFAFVQVGDALVPERRGAIPGAHPEWEYILEPGRVWSEPGDRGFARAAIPFALEERNANCMHNGGVTFLFRPDGTVSEAAYQIASETCFYFKFDAWGRATARYLPGRVAGADAVAAGYREEIAHRLPVKSIAAVSGLGLDAAKFGSPDEVDPDDMTTYGFVAGGTLYAGGCGTRLGPYPFCEVLTLPSYSLAKSIVAGIGLMRLSVLYPGVTDGTIAAHVPACAKAGTWGDVTFADALDMATGHYNSPADQADEDAPDITPFFAADSHAGKIAFACNHYPRRRAPGELWIYHTADAYALGTAMMDFYRTKTGGDFYDGVLVPLWRGLHLDPAIDVSRRTYDAAAQPFTGYGLTLHRDDIAKIALFLQGGGKIGGVPMLDPEMLAQALQRDPSRRGLVASTGDFRYQDGFWAWNAQSTLGCKSPAWIPFMSGYGGIVVALFPNGAVYFYFSDSGVWRWAEAAREANKLKPFCET